jgi:hypothetical protein
MVVRQLVIVRLLGSSFTAGQNLGPVLLIGEMKDWTSRIFQIEKPEQSP